MLNYIHWNPDPEILNVVGIPIRYYGLLFAGGLLTCIYVLRHIFKLEKLPSKNIEVLTVYGFVGILLGARLGHCLFYEPGYYFSHPLEILLPFRFDGGIEYVGFLGMASHGGTLGLLIALILYSRKTKHRLIDTLDLIAIVTALGAGFIRIANLMNSEIIGIPATVPWAFVFERIDDIPRHPAQLYEALSYFLIFSLTIVLYAKKRSSLKNGFFFGLTLALIFTTRFFIEFVKKNQVQFEEGMLLKMGQVLSIPFIIIGVAFMIRSIVKTRRTAIHSLS